MTAPILVHHRVNRAAGISALPAGRGAEIDVRSRGSALVCAHDLFGDGEPLEAILNAWCAGDRGSAPLVLNPKEDGLERPLLAACRDRGLLDVVAFVDLTVPTMVRLSREGVPNMMVRVSTYEPLDHARAFAGHATWAWLDCFEGDPPDRAIVRALHALDYRVCVVSPELEGYPTDRIDAFHALLPTLRPTDAVCTRHPDRWSTP